MNAMDYWLVGSSPLTRGARQILTGIPFKVRLIPAYAGRTASLDTTQRYVEAHPRLRGAHPASSGIVVTDKGSSPLTRGAPVISWPPDGVRRLIPAYAGRTCVLGGDTGQAGAHPRLRGAHPPTPANWPIAPGSSPLTRGAPNGKNASIIGMRLIPAYAGRTGLVSVKR